MRIAGLSFIMIVTACSTMSQTFALDNFEVVQAVHRDMMERNRGCDPVHWGCPPPPISRNYAGAAQCRFLANRLQARCQSEHIDIHGRPFSCETDLRRAAEGKPWFGYRQDCD